MRLVFVHFDEHVRLEINGAEIVDRDMSTPDGSTGLSAIVDAKVVAQNDIRLTTSRGVEMRTHADVDGHTRTIYIDRTSLTVSNSDQLLLD